MSVRIIHDVEEGIRREVRRITTHDSVTKTDTFLEETFDPFTGDIVQTTVEADFYDSSADTGHIQYPHVFVRLMKSREDRFTNRITGDQWGKQNVCANEDNPKPTTSEPAYQLILDMGTGSITAPGTTLGFSTFKVKKILPGYLVRILDGNNIGTYTIDSVTVGTGGAHTLDVTSTIIDSLPTFNFNSTTRVITFLESAAIKTVQVGDIFEDSLASTFTVTAVDLDNVTIEIDGVATPDTSIGSKVTRTGDVFKSTDSDPICFLILDPSKPIISRNGNQVVAGSKNVDASIPIDLFYLVRIDSKERQTHIEILNRVWEEFNPPRTALPTIVRSKDSAEELMTEDMTSGGSTTIKVSNADFNINDTVFVFNDLTPSKSTSGGFEQPFEAKVINKVGTDSLVLDKTVPDTFVISDCTKVVSNATYELLMFHFVDHLTKDVEGAQYWVHEFQFWVQVNVDRQGEPTEFDSNIQGIKTTIEDLN